MMQYQRGPSYSAGATDESLCHAQAIADKEQTPVGIWMRDGWLAVSDVAPEIDEDDTREAEGWKVVAVVDGAVGPSPYASRWRSWPPPRPRPVLTRRPVISAGLRRTLIISSVLSALLAAALLVLT